MSKGNPWFRFWIWIDMLNHDDTGKRKDQHYPVIGCPRFYWVCTVTDFLTRGRAHD